MSSTASSADAGRGAVYDRGYRPYDGPRGRRGAATLALYKASMRRALGLRRPWRQKVAPFVLLGVVTIPAIVNVGIGYVTRDRFDGFQIITYREYVGVSSALLLFVALVAPDVMCPDRRHRVLPLMFARPLLGVDYVVAKVGSITTILFAFSFLPQVVLFVGNMLVSNSALDYVGDHLDVLWVRTPGPDREIDETDGHGVRGWAWGHGGSSVVEGCGTAAVFSAYVISNEIQSTG